MKMKTMIAGILALAVMATVIPAQTASAKPAAMSEKDFFIPAMGKRCVLWIWMMT